MNTATLTTTAVYQNGVLLPKEPPTFPLKEVVVVYIPAINDDNDNEEVELSPEWEAMLKEAQEEVRRGDFLGPFNSAEDAIRALHRETP